MQAERALNAPGWASAVDASSGRTYYYNEDGETSWEAPSAAPSAIVRAPSKKFTANPMNPSATPAAQTPAAQTPSSEQPNVFSALYAVDPRKRRRLGLIGLLALTLVVAGSLLVQHLTSARQGQVSGVAEDGWAVEGQVSGMAPGSSVTATLGTATDDSFLATQTLLASSAGGLAPFAFSGLDPAQSYFLKYEGVGVGLRDAVLVTPPSGGARRRLGVVSLALGGGTQAAPSSAFVFRWRADASRSGAAESASAVKPPTVEFEGVQLRLADDQAAGKLYHDHAIVLAAEWSSEYAYRLLATLAAVPQRAARSFGKPQSLAPSRWTLVDGELPDDIEIRLLPTGAREVRIARAAFVNAAPQVVSLDGVRGTFFSRRLHHAAVRFVTNDGADTAAVQHIAKTRYGITIASAALPAATYRTLTARTTAELAGDFQPFETHASEPLLLLTMFEELPAGFHQVKGLAYVLRRADGHAHPLYPTAPAVAWPTAQKNSYIEFMESAFAAADVRHTRRLILHEKAHFLWANLFSDALKQAWIATAGWYENSAAASGWSTTQQTEFVTAYAHLKNPDEDMAESLSFYVENPAKLQACCPAKFAFIKDRIMHGYRYISKLREDLTFQVLNLAPDFTYPGKIIRTSVLVEGAPEQDKAISVEIELHRSAGAFDGASSAYMRLFSDIGTYKDVYLKPARESGGGDSKHVLFANFTLSKHAKAGLWQPEAITISDLAGNQRFAGMSDFGWRLVLDNPLEDVAKPAYVKGSLGIAAAPATVQGHAVTRLSVSWLFAEDRGMKQSGGVYARLVNDFAPAAGAAQSTAGLQSYGYPGFAAATGCGQLGARMACYRATVSADITEFRASANYGASMVIMEDLAANKVSVDFGTGAADEPQKWAAVATTNFDGQPPELQLNTIAISAAPTNPAAPNGETKVTIVYYARDDKSGLGQVSYRLLDPQGGSHSEYHYHENFRTEFFVGDPTAWKRYEINAVLPVGSAPGTWGLESMELSDKVDNKNAQSFVENLHFQAGGARLLAQQQAAEEKTSSSSLRFVVA